REIAQGENKYYLCELFLKFNARNHGDICVCATATLQPIWGRLCEGAAHKVGQELIMDMLNDPKIQEAFQVLHPGGTWSGLDCKISRVVVSVVPASLTRLDIFDKLMASSPTIVRANGDIAKCMDDVREGFQISDLIRDLLLNEDSENAGLYSNEERDELLWRLFEHMVLGGACCQFEVGFEGPA
ncbi:hypothetical protein Vretifemale_2587, partial [Volvox reticuliferus]